MYPSFAKVAEEEGFAAIAATMRAIAIAEKHHENTYKTLVQNIEEGKVFKRDGVCIWACRNCGYLHEGTEAPKACPACAHPQKYFEKVADNF